ncbi:MAG: PAS domain S-box protein [Planctomycetes bacterium]|nr:PAS domain S-box protein [Planctomycetota bacterium]MBL7042801.1 PAS domain S-box protein [Pirellulaceae bacterium]
MPNAQDNSRHSRLLVVDDDASQLSTLVGIFETEGFAVVGCSTGAEALEHLGGESIGMAVVDLRLPDLSGTELLAKLETLSETVQVIIHTAYGSYESAKDAVNLGAFAYVEKGTEHNELIRQVHRAFQARLEKYAADLEDAVAEGTRELREANEALIGAANEWRTTFDSTQDAIMLLDIDHRVLRANRAAAEFVGVAVDALVGKKCHELVHDLDAPPDFCPFHEAKRTKQRVQLETQLADGGRWVAITMDPVLDEAGNVTAAVHVVTDITERKQAEQDLLFRDRAVNAAAEGISITDPNQPDHPAVYVNRGFERLTGYNSEEVLGRNMRFLQGPDTDPEALREMRTAIQEERECTVEILNYRKDGTPYWNRLAIAPVRDEEDKITHFIGVHADVTELRESQRQLAEQLAELDHVYRNSPVGLCVVDTDLRYVRVNDALAAFNGKPASEHIGRTMREVIPELAPGIEPIFRSVIDSGRAELESEVHGTTSAEPDVEKDWLVSYYPIKSGGGEMLGVGTVVQDITDRKKAEEGLRQRDAELVHLGRLAAMGELAAGLAHELNQPLYAITNYTTGIAWRLRDGVDEPGELNDTMEKVVAQARRAADIIGRLRGAVKKRELSMGPVNLNDLLQDILKLLDHEIKQDSITVRLDLPADLPPAFADDIQIQQVAVNLIRNALDAMRDVPSDQRCLTLMTSVAEGDTIEVGVGDTGKGLSDEARDKLFDPFFTTKVEGLGMGLAISQTIVEAHKGRIWTTSNSPQGTVFRFVVPTAEGGLNRAN